MGTETASIATVPVTQMSAVRLADDYDTRLNHFRTSLAVFQTMVKNGILVDGDYHKICDTLARKYGISLCSIFR